MSVFEKLVKDYFLKPPSGPGRRSLDLEKVFSAIRVYLENENTLSRSCKNAGIPHVAVYENYVKGKELTKKITLETEKNEDSKNNSSLDFNFNDREVEQIEFFLQIEQAKEISLMRAKKYLAFTLSEAEQEIVEFKRKEKERVESADKEGKADEKTRNTFEPNPEVLKTIRWLLERREKERYSARTEVDANGAFSFNVSFQDLPPTDHTPEDDDLTNKTETPKKPTPSAEKKQVKASPEAEVIQDNISEPKIGYLAAFHHEPETFYKIADISVISGDKMVVLDTDEMAGEFNADLFIFKKS